MPAIDVVDLSKTYRYHHKEPGLGGSLRALLRRQMLETHAVDSLTFSIEAGEIVGFLHLLRPASSQFIVSLRLLNMPEAVNVLIGLGLAAYAGQWAGVRWSAVAVAEAAGLLLCGLAVLYALWFAVVTLAFWLVQVDTLDTLFYSIFEAARYPVSFFQGGVRTLLAFVVPVAFATTFPAEALLGTVDHRLLPIGIVLAVLSLLASHRFWQ